MFRTQAASIALLAAAFAAQAQEPHAHVHGIATLDVAIDGNTLTLGFDSPLDNLVGFEHPPGNEKEKRALDAMTRRFSKPESLFVPTPAAGCVVTGARVGSPFADGAKAADGKNEGGHHHADIESEITWRCARPDALRTLDAPVLREFPGIRELRTQVAGPRGQSSATLTAAARAISF
jgi:hypothetical protein